MSINRKLIEKGENWMEEVFLPTVAPLYFPNVMGFNQVFRNPGENEYYIDHDYSANNDGTIVMCIINGGSEVTSKCVEAINENYSAFCHPFKIAAEAFGVGAEIYSSADGFIIFSITLI